MARASQTGAVDISSAFMCGIGVARSHIDRALASHPQMRVQPSGSNL